MISKQNPEHLAAGDERPAADIAMSEELYKLPSVIRPFDLEEFIRKHQKTPETASFLRKLATAPSRNPNGYFSKTFFYPCPFVGYTLKAESAWEFAAMLTLVQRPDVLRIYEQAPKQTCCVKEPGRPPRTYSCVLDLVLLLANGDIEAWEVMPDDDAAYQTLINPKRFQACGDGRYISRPTEAHLARLGIKHFILYGGALNANLVAWANYLRPYTTGDSLDPITSSESNAIINAVRDEPGLFLEDVETGPGQPIRNTSRLRQLCNFLLGRGVIFTNTCDTTPSQHDEIRLYPTPLHLRVYDRLRHATRKPPKDLNDLQYKVIVGTTIVIKGREYVVTKLDDKRVTLADAKNGKETTHPFRVLLDMKPLIGLIYGAEKLFEAKLSMASASDLLVMLSREAFLDRGEKLEMADLKAPAERSARRWRKSVKRMVAHGGVPLEALLPAHGGRGSQLDPKIERLLDRLIARDYLCPDGVSAKSVYYRLVAIASRFKLGRIPDYTTIARHCQSIDPYKKALKRQGKRWAARYLPVYPKSILGNPAGIASFGNAHIDSTTVDIVNDDKQRRHLIKMVDSYDGSILAHFLSKKPITVAAVRILLIRCVKKFRMLPSVITCDWGAEGKSTYIQTTLARLGVMLILRPKSTPSAGVNIETMFSKLCKNLLNNMRGNTKLLKHARMVTRAVNPQDRAVWTEEGLDELLSEYFELINDVPRRNRLAPNVMRQKSFASFGCPPTQQRNVELFRRAMLPLVEGTTRVVSTRGFVRHRDHAYTCDGLSHYAGKELFVRYDEDDIMRVYVELPDRCHQMRECNCVDSAIKYSPSSEAAMEHHLRVSRDKAGRKKEILIRQAEFEVRMARKQKTQPAARAAAKATNAPDAAPHITASPSTGQFAAMTLTFEKLVS